LPFLVEPNPDHRFSDPHRLTNPRRCAWIFGRKPTYTGVNLRDPAGSLKKNPPCNGKRKRETRDRPDSMSLSHPDPPTYADVHGFERSGQISRKESRMNLSKRIPRSARFHVAVSVEGLPIVGGSRSWLDDRPKCCQEFFNIAGSRQIDRISISWVVECHVIL